MPARGSVAFSHLFGKQSVLNAFPTYLASKRLAPRQARLAPDRRGEGGKKEGGTWEPTFRWLQMEVG